MQGGSVSQLVQEFGPLSEGLAKIVVRHVLLALEYLHARHIIHRDVKAANVLSDGKGTFKLGDLGISELQSQLKRITEGSETAANAVQGSFYWMAPELLLEGTECRRSDVWGTGCLLVELVSGRHPWQDCSSLVQFLAVLKQQRRPQPPPALSTCGRQFLGQCFCFQSRNRPSVVSLLHHQWLQG